MVLLDFVGCLPDLPEWQAGQQEFLWVRRVRLPIQFTRAGLTSGTVAGKHFPCFCCFTVHCS